MAPNRYSIYLTLFLNTVTKPTTSNIIEILRNALDNQTVWQFVGIVCTGYTENTNTNKKSIVTNISLADTSAPSGIRIESFDSTDMSAQYMTLTTTNMIIYDFAQALT